MTAVRLRDRPHHAQSETSPGVVRQIPRSIQPPCNM